MDLQLFTSTGTCDLVKNEYSWNMLPVEIWLEIFKFLTHPMLLFVIRKVCRQFKVLVFDPILWKRIDMNLWKNCAAESYLHQTEDLEKSFVSLSLTYEDEIDNLEKKLMKKGYLNSTDMFSPVISFAHESVKEILFSRYISDFVFGKQEQSSLGLCCHLTHLDVGFCENINSSILKNICCYCPKLHVLILESCRNITDDSLQAVCNLNQLEKLDISHCAGITDVGVHFISLMPCRLKHFISDGVLHISDVGLIDLVYHQDEMESLIVDGEELTDTSIIMATCTLTNLTAFQISFCTHLTEKCIVSLLGKYRLKHLCLKKISDKISSSSLEQFFLHQPLQQLKYLSLTDSNLLNDCVMHSIAHSCSMLEHLQLDWCTEITDDGICAISSKCRRLKQLLLVGLARLEGKWLPSIVDQLPHLELLDLSVCNMIPDKEVYSLVMRMPNLVAYTYFHEKLDSTTVNSMYVCLASKNSSFSEEQPPACAGSKGATVDF